MAEGAAPEVADPIAVAAVDMDVEKPGENGGETNQKRSWEDEEPLADDVSKKQKVDEEKSVEEQRLENSNDQEGKGKETEEDKMAEAEEEGKEEDAASVSVKLGYKSFGSSSEMYHYFFNILHHWPQYININKYEHVMLLELLKNGHAEPERKMGGGVRAFQVRKHPTYQSRCFFLIREDDSVDDFSFRKCVDHILPLPDGIHLKSDSNKEFGGNGGGGGKGGRGWRGGRGGRGGRGRGGRGGRGGKGGHG